MPRPQTTASEATLVALLAARSMAIQRYLVHSPDENECQINTRLVAYCSDQVIYIYMYIYLIESNVFIIHNVDIRIFFSVLRRV